MEYINQVVLAGKVGNIKLSQVGEKEVANMQVVTNRVYVGSDGSTAVNATWHNVVVWGGDGRDLSFVQKGSEVRIEGSLRSRRYTGSDGVERYVTEVLAEKFTLLQ